MCGLILFGAAVAVGYNDMDAQINGAYAASYNTSYCRAGELHCTPQARVSSILNEPTGYGYSVKYNYGLEPQPTGSTWSASSSSYNYGSRMK